MAGLKKEIEGLHEKFVTGFKSGNMDEMLGFYTDDAKIMMSGFPLVEGKSGAQEMLKMFGEMGVKDGEMTPHDVGTAGGDVVYERGSYVFKGEGGKVLDTGKYVTLWKRVGGSLKIYTDIQNSDKGAQ